MLGITIHKQEQKVLWNIDKEQKNSSFSRMEIIF